MKVKCIDNNLCSTLTLNKEYSVVEEATEYYVCLLYTYDAADD